MSLVRSVQPMPDESLAGLVARAAAANVYPHVHHVLEQLEKKRWRPEAIAVQPLEVARDLARVLGTEDAKLRSLFYPALDAVCIDFFGTPLRAIYREPSLRRVSPRALKSSAYVRAIWSLRPLSFDPRTRETLIDTCPECGGTLGFTHTWGVEFCEHCLGEDEWGSPVSKVDLREFPQPLVETDDEEALDFVTAQIDPAGEEIRRQYRLHDDLESLPRGERFQLALSLVAAMDSTRGDGRQWLAASKKPGRPVDPQLLARAGRVLLGWPKSLIPLCEEARQRAGTRQGEWGKHKEFGALAALPSDPFLRPATQRVVREALHGAFGVFAPTDDRPLALVHRNLGEYITSSKLREATSITTRICARLASHPSVVSVKSAGSSMRSIAFPVFQVEPIARHLLDLTKEINACTTLGLPPDGLRDLASVDFIHAKEGGYADVAVDVYGDPGKYYSRASMDRMVDLVVRGLRFVPRPEGYVPLLEAMLMFPAGHRPWLPVLMRVLFEQVPAVLHVNLEGKTKVTDLFTSISVRGLDAMRAEIMAEHASPPTHDIENVSAVATGLMLGFKSHYVFVDCVGAGLLTQNPDKSVTYASVMDFARRLIFANEAAVRSGISYQEVIGWLGGRGVQPKYRFRKGGTVFDRGEVEPLLKMTA